MDFNLQSPDYKTGALGVKLLGQKFKILFSRWPAIGIRRRIRAKYRIDAICPMITNGCSTGMPPIHVRIRTSATSDQNRSWVRGRNVIPRRVEV